MSIGATPIVLILVLAATPAGGRTAVDLEGEPAAAPVQDLDDLPDGDLDYDEGAAPADDAIPPGPGDDEEAAAPAAEDKGKDKDKDTDKPAGKKPIEPEPASTGDDGEELTPPPDDRPADADEGERKPAASEPEIEMGEVWVDDEVKDGKARAPVQEDFEALEREEQERERGRLMDEEEERPLIENPWFWGGVAGGAVLLAAAAAGGGYLIYTMFFGNTGTVNIVLE